MNYDFFLCCIVLVLIFCCMFYIYKRIYELWRLWNANTETMIKLIEILKEDCKEEAE